MLLGHFIQSLRSIRHQYCYHDLSFLETTDCLQSSDAYRITSWFLKGHMSSLVCPRVILSFIPQMCPGIQASMIEMWTRHHNLWCYKRIHGWPSPAWRDSVSSLLENLARTILIFAYKGTGKTLNPFSLLLILFPQNKVILMAYPFLQRTHLHNNNN